MDVYFHSVVGDNLERAAGTIATAATRSDAVIITGGLGPTPDDLTRQAVARAFGLELQRNDEMERAIRTVFERLARPMPETNLRQADLPAGATPIPPEGTAPGFFVEIPSGTIVVAVPGVPWEMEAMLTNTVLPLLRERSGAGVIATRHVMVTALGESRTHEKISDIIAAQSNPTIAYLASAGLVRVRISAKAATESEASSLIVPVEAEIRGRLGDDALPAGNDTIAGALGDQLRSRGASVGCAESLTGGLLGAALTEESGASDYFRGSLVCYTDDAKRDIAGVDPAILQQSGGISEATAGAMAAGAAARLRADLGLATTGVAGPAEQEGKPVGTIYVGAAFGGTTEVRHVLGYGDRDHIRRIAVNAALDLGRRVLQSRQ